MLSNMNLLANIGFDTDENGPTSVKKLTIFVAIFYKLYKKTPGTMYRAWMASVDTDRNGTVGPDRFYQATKKIGYGGDLPALFKSYAKLGRTARSGKLYRACSRRAAGRPGAAAS